jgi:hypothetical protein
MVTKLREQIHFEETIIEDAELEQILDDSSQSQNFGRKIKRLKR